MKRALVTLFAGLYVLFTAWLFDVDLLSRGCQLGYTFMCATAVSLWAYFYPRWK